MHPELIIGPPELIVIAVLVAVIFWPRAARCVVCRRGEAKKRPTGDHLCDGCWDDLHQCLSRDD